MSDFDKVFKSDVLLEIQDNFLAFQSLVVSLDPKKLDHHVYKEIFRLVHNMKGNSSAAGFDSITNLFHSLETKLLEVDLESIQCAIKLTELLQYCNSKIAMAIDHFKIDLNSSEMFFKEKDFIDRFEISHVSDFSFLVVDDELDLLDVLDVALTEDFNCSVLTAQNGLVALELCRTKKFDFIVTDFKMPDLNGLELLQFLRDEKSLNILTPIVFMSGYRPDLLPLNEIWNNVFIVDKPFARHKLNFLIKCGLNLKKLA